MSEPTDYRPIACEIYSEYEVAILHRARLWLHWRDGAGMHHVGVILPRDLETCHGEEFLHMVDAAGASHRIRLDHILEYRQAS